MSRSILASFGSVRFVLGTLLAGLAVAVFGSPAHAVVLQPLPTLTTGGANLVLRLDANAINGDGNPNLTNGASVSTWTDLSSNSHDATQVTSAKQPIFLANQTPNGSGAVAFNGSTQFLLDPATISGATTWFIVYNTFGGPSSGNFESPVSLPATDPATATLGYDQIDLLNVASYQNISVHTELTANNNTVGISPAFDSDNHLFAFTFNGATGTGNQNPVNYQMAYDQTNTTVNTSSIFGFGPFSTTEGTIGQRGDNTLSTYFSGNISAILVYSGALNSTDYSAVQSYLNQEFLVAPEPTSLALLLVGGVMTLRRRRHQMS